MALISEGWRGGEGEGSKDGGEEVFIGERKRQGSE